MFNYKTLIKEFEDKYPNITKTRISFDELSKGWVTLVGDYEGQRFVMSGICSQRFDTGHLNTFKQFIEYYDEVDCFIYLNGKEIYALKEWN